MDQSGFEVEIIAAESPLRDAARIAAEAITMADRANGAARLAIAGGLPDGFLVQLRMRLSGGDEDASPGYVWPRMKLTWVDEVCVPTSDPRSKRGAVARTGSLAARYAVGHELALYCDGEEPEAAAARFSRQFAQVFDGGLDVAVVDLATMLAIGPTLLPGAVVQRFTAGDDSECLALSAQIVADAPLLVVVAHGRSADEAVGLLRSRSRQIRRRAPGAICVVSDVAATLTTRAAAQPRPLRSAAK